jgi:hypothetical protein
MKFLRTFLRSRFDLPTSDPTRTGSGSACVFMLILVALIVFPKVLLGADCGQTHFENALIEGIDPNYAALSIRDCTQPSAGAAAVCDCPITNMKVDDLALRADLKSYRVGDHIRLDIKAGQGASQLLDLHGFWSTPISPLYVVLALAVSALVILGVAAAVTHWAPQKLILGMDNRYSNSKFQLALWFWLIISTYIATVVLRISAAGWTFFGNISIPQNLLVLSGLSALTYGGAKAITTAKVDTAENPVPPFPGAVVPPPIANPKHIPGDASFFANLVQNDIGGFDFGDFQMLVVTLLAVAMYLILVYGYLRSIGFQKAAALPDVDTTVLAMFGLGQGAYLTKKAAGNVGTS